jgi:hypothetical protein
MESTALRHLLVTDWAKVENTPVRDRRSASLRRWHMGAESLAQLEERPVLTVVNELKEEARQLAERQRQDLMTELARDLAVCQALGLSPTPPWQRRLNRLVQLMSEPLETVQQQVEQVAAAVHVVVLP